MQSVKLSQLSHMQKNTVMDYIAAHKDFSSQDPIVHFSTCSVDITFPEDYFTLLREKEAAVAKERAKLQEMEKKQREGARKPSPPQQKDEAAAAAPPPVKSLAWLLRITDDIYNYRGKQFVLEGMTKAFRAAPRCVVDDLAIYAFDLLSKRFGVPEIVRKTSLELLESVKFHRSIDHDAQLFSILLSSSSYDTVDVQNLLDWRSVLMPFTHLKTDTVHLNHPNLGHVQRRYVRVCEIPALIRKCVAAGGTGEHRPAVFNRCRDALAKWCDDDFRFPAVVPDPNFYCPPFHPRSPYLGSSGATNLTLNEARFYAVRETSVVPLAQLLLLLLQNSKAERLDHRVEPHMSAASGKSPALKNHSFRDPLDQPPPLAAPSAGKAHPAPFAALRQSTPRESQMSKDAIALELRLSRMSSF